MFYRLYWEGSLYDTTKYQTLEEAKRAAEKYNTRFQGRHGLVYVCDKRGKRVA